MNDGVRNDVEFGAGRKIRSPDLSIAGSRIWAQPISSVPHSQTAQAAFHPYLVLPRAAENVRFPSNRRNSVKHGRWRDNPVMIARTWKSVFKKPSRSADLRRAKM